MGEFGNISYHYKKFTPRIILDTKTYQVGTYSKTIIEAQNHRISLNHFFRYEKNMFETKLEGFFFCLSPDPLCLQESDYKTIEDFNELENHKYADSIKSRFQIIINTPYSLIIRKFLLPH